MEKGNYLSLHNKPDPYLLCFFFFNKLPPGGIPALTSLSLAGGGILGGSLGHLGIYCFPGSLLVHRRYTCYSTA